MKRRYARDYDADRRRSRRMPSMDSLRRSPIRNGLIGIAVAGAAAPIAVDRYQQALRTDPTHERMSTQLESAAAATPGGVAAAYNALEAERTTEEQAREEAIAANVAEFADYGLSEELAGDIYDLAREADVDPEIAFGLIRAESSFKNTSTSHVGAVGLMQLMPRTAAWLVPGTTTADLRNPDTNLKIGMKYLKQLIDKYDGDVDLALTAYNRGPGTVDRILGRGGNPDNGYAGFVRTGDIGSHKG